MSEEVSLGDMVTFAPKFTVSKNGKEWIAPNWNGRISVNQTIDLLCQIYENQLSFPFDLYMLDVRFRSKSVPEVLKQQRIWLHQT